MREYLKEYYGEGQLFYFYKTLDRVFFCKLQFGRCTDKVSVSFA